MALPTEKIDYSKMNWLALKSTATKLGIKLKRTSKLPEVLQLL